MNDDGLSLDAVIAHLKKVYAVHQEPAMLAAVLGTVDEYDDEALIDVMVADLIELVDESDVANKFDLLDQIQRGLDLKRAELAKEALKAAEFNTTSEGK